ncbi:MAG: RluA family pseudouridine synthase [Roseovarius sp.]|nr:RluA family pseudouridine synthase [Roseovarius sp.]
MSATRLKFQIAANPPQRLDKALSRDVPEEATLSRTRLAKLIANGHVKLNGDVATDISAKVAEADIIEISIPELCETTLMAQEIPLDILYEDREIIVLNKRAGLVVHPAPGNRDGTLVNALMAHCGDSLSGIGGEKRPGIVHRIDKDTSGVIVAAKSQIAHGGLAEQFKSHSVERRYLCLAHGVPYAGDARLRGLRGIDFEAGNVMKISTRIARHRNCRKRQAVVFDGGRNAVTRTRVLEMFGNPPAISMMECRLETGRTHQIRVHLAYAGHALIGDQVYGTRRRLPRKAFSEAVMSMVDGFSRQALHASELGFEHPVNGKWMRFSAPVPDDMSNLAETIKSQH